VSVEGKVVLVSDNGGNGVSFSVDYFDSNVGQLNRDSCRCCLDVDSVRVVCGVGLKNCLGGFSVASFFVIGVEGIVVGKGCYSNKYKVVFIDNVDPSVGDSNDYVGGEYCNVRAIFVRVFWGVESFEGFLQVGVVYLGEFSRESRFSSVRGT
jgi:hypothetical protein